MITLNQHKAHLTKRIIASFSDDSAPKLGLSSWFPSLTTSAKMISIEVERNRQLVASQVQRNTGGNINTFSNSNEKMYIPPYFEEIFDFTAAQSYDATFGNGNNPNQSQVIDMIRDTSKRLKTLKDKIQRAIELQRAQALQTGIVIMKNGDNIDYKRKAASLVTKTGTDVWANADGKPLDDVAAAIKFIRQEGKSALRQFDLILGEAAFSDFMNNAQVKATAEFRRISILEIGTTRFDNTTGLNFHGQFSTKNGLVNIWTYDDFYENENGTFSEYIDPKNALVLPRDFVGTTSFAGVPAIRRDKSNAEYPEFIQQMEAEFFVNNYVDPRKKAHWFEICSAPLAVPVSVDRVVTIKTAE